MKNKIINYILNNQIINEYFNKVQPEYKNDFKQHIWLIIMETLNNKDKYNRIKELYLKGNLGRYVVGIINNQLKSNTSSFTKQFKQTYMTIDDIEICENEIDVKDNTYIITNIIKVLDNCYFVDAVLFKLYFGIHPITNQITEPKTYQEIQAIIGVNYQSVRSAVLKIQKIIQDNITYDNTI